MNAPRPSTAKIYQFPVRARPVAVNSRQQGALATERRVQMSPDVDFGSAWYHEAAVQDAMRASKP